MKQEDVYLVGTRLACYRTDEPRRVIGVKMFTKDNGNPVTYETWLAYHVRFEDGKEDYVSFEMVKTGNFEFKTLSQLITQ